VLVSETWIRLPICTVSPETTANFSHLRKDLRQCAYDQGEPVTTDLSFGTRLTLVMCRSFLNSDVRGRDCALQVNFFCLCTLASSEMYRGINFSWTHKDHSSQDTAQAYNVKIRRFSSCRVADVPWTSPLWQAGARSAWPYGQSRECTPPSAAAPWLWLKVHVQDVPHLWASIHNGTRQSGKDKWRKVLQPPQYTSLLFWSDSYRCVILNTDEVLQPNTTL
jgi:hypothetical protein